MNPAPFVLGLLDNQQAAALGSVSYGDAASLAVLVTFLIVAAALVFVGIAAVVVMLVLVVLKDPTRSSTQLNSAPYVHTLSFDVGASERHTVAFRFDQRWGWLTVAVDGNVIVKKLVMFSVSLVRTFEFSVGQAEMHNVRIEKRRPLLVSFARTQPIRAFVDGILVAEDAGKATA